MNNNYEFSSQILDSGSGPPPGAYSSETSSLRSGRDVPATFRNFSSAKSSGAVQNDLRGAYIQETDALGTSRSCGTRGHDYAAAGRWTTSRDPSTSAPQSSMKHDIRYSKPDKGLFFIPQTHSAPLNAPNWREIGPQAIPGAGAEPPGRVLPSVSPHPGLASHSSQLKLQPQHGCTSKELRKWAPAFSAEEYNLSRPGQPEATSSCAASCAPPPVGLQIRPESQRSDSTIPIFNVDDVPDIPVTPPGSRSAFDMDLTASHRRTFNAGSVQLHGQRHQPPLETRLQVENSFKSQIHSAPTKRFEVYDRPSNNASRGFVARSPPGLAEGSGGRYAARHHQGTGYGGRMKYPLPASHHTPTNFVPFQGARRVPWNGHGHPQDFESPQPHCSGYQQLPIQHGQSMTSNSEWGSSFVASFSTSVPSMGVSNCPIYDALQLQNDASTSQLARLPGIPTAEASVQSSAYTASYRREYPPGMMHVTSASPAPTESHPEAMCSASSASFPPRHLQHESTNGSNQYGAQTPDIQRLAFEGHQATIGGTSDHDDRATSSSEDAHEGKQEVLKQSNEANSKRRARPWLERLQQLCRQCMCMVVNCGSQSRRRSVR